MTADVPGLPGWRDDVRARLFDRRVVVISGELDQTQSSEIAAELMTLDALGDEHIELRIHSSTGSIEGGLVVVDVIEVLGVPVHSVGLGVVGGGVVGVLAAGEQRSLAPHARLHLREPDIEVAGRATDIEQALAEELARREVFYRFLARRTQRPVAEIESEWAAGRFLTAEDAATLGYVQKTPKRIAEASPKASE